MFTIPQYSGPLSNVCIEVKEFVNKFLASREFDLALKIQLCK